MDSLIKFGAKYLILVPVAVLLYMLYRTDNKQRKQMLIIIVAGGILTVVLGQIAGHIYTNPRPPFSDGVTPLFKPSDYNGFPSDHTLMAAYLAFVAWGYSRKLGAVLLLVALLIGWARVAAGVHHFVDIVGGFVIAAIAWTITDYAVRHFYNHGRE